MLIIRLSRTGKHSQPSFRVVIAEHTTAVKGKALEVLGSYNPHTNKASLNQDRIKHWLSLGVKTSPTVHNLFINEKLLEGKKVTAWKLPMKKKKALAEAAAKKAEEEKKEKPAEETKPEETATEAK